MLQGGYKNIPGFGNRVYFYTHFALQTKKNRHMAGSVLLEKAGTPEGLRLEDAVDEIVADSEACTHFNGAAKTRVQEVRQEPTATLALLHGWLAIPLRLRHLRVARLPLLTLPLHGCYVVLHSLVHGLHDGHYLLLFGLDVEGQFLEVQKPFASVSVAAVCRGLELAGQRLQALHHTLGFLL